MPLKPEELDLATNCFGYGSWRAKYWFVGLEERLDPSEKGDCTKRAEAFRELNIEGLCDLKKFHEKIGEERWQTSLQFTWGRMIWLLKNYLAEDSGHCALLRYQSQSLGSSTGETCVTELSGLPRDSSSNGNGNALLSNNKTVLEAVRTSGSKYCETRFKGTNQSLSSSMERLKSSIGTRSRAAICNFETG